MNRLSFAVTRFSAAGLLLAAVWGSLSSTANANLILSHNNTNRTLGGVTFGNGSLVNYNQGTDTATQIIEGDDSSSVFRTGQSGSPPGADENIDAVEWLSGTQVILSLNGAGRLQTTGGSILDFQDDDLILYDITADIATMLLDGADVFRQANGNLGADAEIDALGILPNGHFLISTNQAERIRTTGGAIVEFSPNDLIEYDAVNDVATVYLSATGSTSIFRNLANTAPENRDIKSVQVLADGTLLLGVETGNARLTASGGGLLSFTGGQIVRYDPVSNVASLFFDGETLMTGGANKNIDAIATDFSFFSAAVPEPASMSLLLVGFSLLGARHCLRRRKSGAQI